MGSSHDVEGWEEERLGNEPSGLCTKEKNKSRFLWVVLWADVYIPPNPHVEALTAGGMVLGGGALGAIRVR